MAEFTTRGFTIHYVEQGEGPAVVFVHGFVMDHTMFAPQFEDLPDRYRCIAWDMRGHGRSDCPPGPWSMEDTVVDLVRFIEETNAAPCHLVGMSWGGMIALRIALWRQDLIRSLVLIDTSADAEDPERIPLYRGYADLVANEGVTDELSQSTLALFYGEKYRTSEPEATAIHVARAKDMPREAIVEGIRALTRRDSVSDRLGDVRAPALVIHGAEDASIPMERAFELADGIPDAELHRIAEAGHTTPLEAPDEVNRILADFLDRVTWGDEGPPER